jgi:hypothetical protein
VRVEPLDRAGIAEAQALVAARHYLGKPVDARCSVEGYGVFLDREQVGVMLLGRPQATACYPWYGSLEDVAAGRAECSRWSVLNLARVWFSPLAQHGGVLHEASHLPGFVDRGGEFRSTLGSAAIAALADEVVTDYLLRRPPCFLNEPYELRWLLSYCDTRRHTGTLYRAAGFELYRMNEDGVQTWRLPLRPLGRAEHSAIAFASWASPRSNAHRARRAQLSIEAA